jgi:hypothetical protein
MLACIVKLMARLMLMVKLMARLRPMVKLMARLMLMVKLMAKLIEPISRWLRVSGYGPLENLIKLQSMGLQIKKTRIEVIHTNTTGELTCLLYLTKY